MKFLDVKSVVICRHPSANGSPNEGPQVSLLRSEIGLIQKMAGPTDLGTVGAT